MVLLTLTQAAKAAADEYVSLRTPTLLGSRGDRDPVLDRLSGLEIGDPVDHEDLIQIATSLRERARDEDRENLDWRLDRLLKGAAVHRLPPPSKSEPVN